MSISNLRLGMVGIGVMGHGIASTLVRHGYPMVFLDHPGNQPVDDLVEAGARSVASLSALAAESDVVILCVTGSPEVEAVLLGRVVWSSTCGRGRSSSTIQRRSRRPRYASPETVSKAGGRFLDAPMTGTPMDAAAGGLNLLVGGDPALFEEYQPLLAAYAKRIVHAGPVGAGHQLKLLHNFVSVGFGAVLAEAVACAERAHVDIPLFVEVLAAGGGNSTMLDRMRPFIELRDTSAYKFSIGNAAKDLGYYVALAEELDASRATAAAIRGVYAEAVAAGHGRESVPEMITFLLGD